MLSLLVPLSSRLSTSLISFYSLSIIPFCPKNINFHPSRHFSDSKDPSDPDNGNNPNNFIINSSPVTFNDDNFSKENENENKNEFPSIESPDQDNETNQSQLIDSNENILENENENKNEFPSIDSPDQDNETNQDSPILSDVEGIEEMIDISFDSQKMEMKPAEVVNELNRYIVGQESAKRAVSIALRQRWRRHHLEENIKEEVVPKNILMIGPTGVGKTEIARRLAKMMKAPFVKVEATKYTETGYHGRDVDDIIVDLVHNAHKIIIDNLKNKCKDVITKKVNQKILKSYFGPKPNVNLQGCLENFLNDGYLEDSTIEIELPIKDTPSPLMFKTNSGMAAMPLQSNMGNLNFMKILFPTQVEKRKMKVSQARKFLEDHEIQNYIKKVDTIEQAIRLAENDGIVFIDELDKICRPSTMVYNSDASAEGVQRDLLPLIEGCNISVNGFGTVNTGHILFICSGSFHSCKPSDLMPELQGRLPVRVELEPLKEADLLRILTEPEFNLIRQQIELLKTEGINLIFPDESIRHISHMSAKINYEIENIGARRLHTVIERIVEDYSFQAPDLKKGSEIIITPDIINEKIQSLLKKSDLSRFIL